MFKSKFALMPIVVDVAKKNGIPVIETVARFGNMQPLLFVSEVNKWLTSKVGESKVSVIEVSYMSHDKDGGYTNKVHLSDSNGDAS